jgi:nitroreductase
VVVSAVTKDHPKVPEIEQWVAVGAAVQNLWIAAESMGLGVAWKTGSHAYHPGVRAALGLAADEKIIGFIHIGIPMSKAPVRSADFASKTRWI